MQASPSSPSTARALNRLVVHDAAHRSGRGPARVDRSSSTRAWPAPSTRRGRDDEQLLHVDYGNHTLVVPRAEPGYPAPRALRLPGRRGRGHGRHPHGVPPVDRPHTCRAHLSGHRRVRRSLRGRGAGGRAGRLGPRLPTRRLSPRHLTPPAGNRRAFLLHVAYKPVGTDWLGFQAWPVDAEARSWHRFVAEATPAAAGRPSGSPSRAIPIGTPRPWPEWPPGTPLST